MLRIYLHPSGRSVLHRSGFSWSAAFAFPLWALTRRLYKTTLVWCLGLGVACLLLPRLHHVTTDSASMLVTAAYVIAYGLAVGSVASLWHRSVLRRRGYFVGAEGPPPSRATTP